MIRIVTAKRLRRLEAVQVALEKQLANALDTVAVLRAQLASARTERDFYKVEKENWERRASRLIDSIGVTSGTITGAAMSEPAAAESSSAIRTASVPKRSMMSRGSMTFPLVFDIFCLSASRTSPWM